ncbi:hypothetical protein [Herbiconiux daphne]|uniref:Uncharacterized protein n=1 Tax=Herbiconiux daphne TaxID=2970914 RepID=A0ABT2H2J0_9MICO|nr:hypothetical protein [Herbiconiux daphne]MCS5734166.1 hypothetical protein [Herbiconiux daphne]
MSDDPRDDPTRVTNQPSLTTSKGTSWLVLGAIMGAIAVVLLWSLQQVNSTGVAIVGIVAIALLYVAMVEVRLLVRPARLRLLLMAVCFGAIAAVGLVCVLIISTSAAAPVT